MEREWVQIGFAIFCWILALGLYSREMLRELCMIVLGMLAIVLVIVGAILFVVGPIWLGGVLYDYLLYLAF